MRLPLLQSHSLKRLLVRSTASSAVSPLAPPPAQTSWTRPYPPGQVPLYDMALEIIERDSARIKAEIAQKEKEGTTEPAALERMKVLAEINVPETRWKFDNGQVHLREPVYRYFAERKWREKGRLDHLMQRIHTMNVIPDLLPDFHPSFDLHVLFGEEDIEPGIFLKPDQTIDPPRLHVTAFHPDVRLYTLVMVDPDVPDVSTRSFKTQLHWLIPNIPLSARTPEGPINLHDLPHLFPYVPPHPQNGSPYHRYCIFLFPNPQSLPISISPPKSPTNFNLREFVSEWGLAQHEGGGAHMFRELWNPTVSEIYVNSLGRPEPRYGRAPKPVFNAGVRKAAKYI